MAGAADVLPTKQGGMPLQGSDVDTVSPQGSAALAGLGFAGKGLEWVVLAHGTRRLNRQKAGRNLFSASAWDVG